MPTTRLPPRRRRRRSAALLPRIRSPGPTQSPVRSAPRCDGGGSIRCKDLMPRQNEPGTVATFERFAETFTRPQINSIRATYADIRRNERKLELRTVKLQVTRMAVSPRASCGIYDLATSRAFRTSTRSHSFDRNVAPNAVSSSSFHSRSQSAENSTTGVLWCRRRNSLSQSSPSKSGK